MIVPKCTTGREHRAAAGLRKAAKRLLRSLSVPRQARQRSFLNKQISHVAPQLAIAE
jgi:hypothetical protein